MGIGLRSEFKVMEGRPRAEHRDSWHHGAVLLGVPRTQKRDVQERELRVYMLVSGRFSHSLACEVYSE